VAAVLMLGAVVLRVMDVQPAEVTVNGKSRLLPFTVSNKVWP
jgi:hypothetical protein